jgi:hypothetical protein
MESTLFQARFGVLCWCVIKRTIDASHAFVDFVFTVEITEKEVVRSRSALLAAGETTNDANACRLLFAMVTAMNILSKKRTAVWTIIIRWLHLIAAIATSKDLVVSFVHCASNLEFCATA